MLGKKIIRNVRNNKLVKIIIIYFAIVFIFSIIYRLIFLFNTTSFLVSEQLNKHIGGYNYFEGDIDVEAFHKASKDLMPISMSELNLLIKPEIKELDSIIKSIEIKRKSLDSITTKLDSLNQIAQKEMNDSIASYSLSVLRDRQTRIDSMINYLKVNENTNILSKSKYDELAEMEKENAQKDAGLLNNVAKPWSSFISDSLYQKIKQLAHTNFIISSDTQQLSDRKTVLKNYLRDTLDAFYRNRFASVSYYDFLYYSFCVSTTVSFGDIAPNNGLTRLLAVIELLLCMFLVAYILDKIAKGKRSNS